MELKIELARPFGKIRVARNIFFETVKEIAREFHFHLGAAGHALRHTQTALNLPSCGSAAAVAVTEAHKNIFVEILVAVSPPAADNQIRSQSRIVGCCPARVGTAYAGNEMRKNLCAVYTFPAECVKREFVVFTPRDFGGHKVIYAGELHNLRQCAAVAENVGKPEYSVVFAEFIAEESFADEELTHE